jgi:hypothetical protein
MMGSSPRFANLNLVPGITPLGGTVRRTCVVAGASSSQPCWYVEPRVGVIQVVSPPATLPGNSPGISAKLLPLMQISLTFCANHDTLPCQKMHN